MSCAACEDMRELDGVIPDCEKELGCRIPPLTADEARILKLREMLMRLKGLVDSVSVLKLLGAERDDMELLAFVEEIMSGSEAEG